MQNKPDKALAFLARLTTEFTVVLNLADLLNQVVDALRDAAGFDSCAIGLCEQRGGEEVVVVRAGSGLRHIVRGYVLPRGRGLVWQVIDSATPEIVPDLHADARVFRKDPGVRSGIFAPMISQSRRVGVLSAYRAHTDAFTDPDLDLLTVVAGYLAGAVEVARLHEQLQEAATTDSLTGLPNRRTLLERLAGEIGRCHRTARPCSIALLDLDGFKTINDTFGHTAGDAALASFGRALHDSIRQSDLAARYGGDEFVLLMPETSAEQAEVLVTRLRAAEILPRTASTDHRLALCWGVAAWPADGDTADQLLQTADTRLYAMKRRSLSPKAPTA
ncbi:MAG TPA: sensor domain-containing diguanylate cyclase [bacterium]|nr:sensor domain-containing diguanylate cyclase [bacterium]